ncbi:MAG: hypothetical protein LC745_03065, partial [Planctomycetia bacterium]|nr:hypothetical protein [Planctomycetia bacterium]
MSSDSPPAKKSRPRPAARDGAAGGAPPAAAGLRLLDLLTLAAFLALTFLLGAFPLKDTDFWWHLRTGDLIRQTGSVPHADWYTYGARGNPWVDLHWLFQVAVSLVYERGGVRALTLAKCAVTCLAVSLLVTARRRDWPSWVMLTAWLPALLVLGGRMYVRPETLTGLACLFNPYGLRGALYPLQLARTMGNPIFSHTIAELTPIDEFIRRDGFISVPLRLHLLTLVIGALSFLVPMTWVVVTRLHPLRPAPVAARPGPPGKVGDKAKASKRSSRAVRPAAEAPAWRLSPFRLLLYVAFSVLSWQATRNSHQFAAVVGSVTAWNLGEWAAAVRRRAAEARGPASPANGPGVAPRLAALALIAAVFGWVATGRFYEAAGEGRTIGLGEQPLWFPHGAVKFAGRPEMPPRFLSYHIGHASLYDYYYGPKRKVFADARLEVIGPDLYERYTDLHDRIAQDDRSWSRELDEIGRPVVLIDLENNGLVGGTLLNSPDWRCVWFDPVAAVFVHASHHEVVGAHGVDFAARHFRPEPAFEPRGSAAMLASARGLRNLASGVGRSGPDRVRPLALLGMDHARRAGQDDRDAAEPWKLLAQFEFLREPPPVDPVPRFRMPFDPVFDLSTARATYALLRALEANPGDFMTLYLLANTFKSRGMNEEAVAMLDRLVTLAPINGFQAREQLDAEGLRGSLRAAMGPEPSRSWENLAQLSEVVNRQLASGRAASAADHLTGDTPDAGRSWEESDRIATLRLHLGQPAEARRLWRAAAAPPRPALRDARVAVTELVEADFNAARASYQAATTADPELFEAQYGLAVLEQDAGRAAESLAAARKAVNLAPRAVARSAAQG